MQDDKVFEWFDKFVDWLKDQSRPDTYMLNPKRLNDMQRSAALLKTALQNADCHVQFECEHHEFDSSMGVIRIEGPEIEFLGSKDFAEAASLATNVEAYPLKTNRVRMALMFYDLLVPI